MPYKVQIWHKYGHVSDKDFKAERQLVAVHGVYYCGATNIRNLSTNRGPLKKVPLLFLQ